MSEDIETASLTDQQKVAYYERKKREVLRKISDQSPDKNRPNFKWADAVFKCILDGTTAKCALYEVADDMGYTREWVDDVKHQYVPWLVKKVRRNNRCEPEIKRLEKLSGTITFRGDTSVNMQANTIAKTKATADRICKLEEDVKLLKFDSAVAQRRHEVNKGVDIHRDEKMFLMKQQGFTYKEVGAHFDVSVSTVKRAVTSFKEV